TLDASVNNDGLCTLREAITAANLNTASGAVAGECVKGDGFPTVDTIAFNIPGSGVQTITPGSDLPPITEAVTINGYSQHPCPDAAPCSKENAQPFFQAGDAVLLIEINGSNTVNNGLVISGGTGSTIKGLIINRFLSQTLRITSSTGNTIAGNFLST